MMEHPEKEACIQNQQTDQTLAVRLLPFQRKLVAALLKLLDSPQVAPYIDMPVNEKSLTELAEHSTVLEHFGLGAYRVIGVHHSKTFDHTRNACLDPRSFLQIAGLIGFTRPEVFEDTAVLGTWLGESFQGKGINSLAKRDMLQLAFANPDITRVIWMVEQTNIRAIRASRKLPYTIETETIAEQDQPLWRYKKWYEFKTGLSVAVFQVTRAAFFADTIKSGR
ncbi:GNAT family N-acetyltransferase [Fodinisporobacter ferrooxydans]|uniref:GNAT family N-acetyltransferase n=1 Tax=Fodinisporobacter ferrooxydans TaxID=2901836 RepID=A0ABY4CUJ8_9BACL|nr:GNAT family N-acetyltransferase [Alicyclobacillaceae bacterium MYW30-H2]